MRKFESLQKDESRAQSAHFSKAYRKPGAFICHCTRIALAMWAVSRSAQQQSSGLFY